MTSVLTEVIAGGRIPLHRVAALVQACAVAVRVVVPEVSSPLASSR